MVLPASLRAQRDELRHALLRAGRRRVRGSWRARRRACASQASCAATAFVSARSTVAASAACHWPTVSRRSAGIGHRRCSAPPTVAPGTSGVGAPVGLRGGVDLLGERAQLIVVGEVDAHGIAPLDAEAAVQVDRLRDARMRDGFECGTRLRPDRDEVIDGDVLVGDAVDEAGVGAVLEQAAHQVRQQVLVRADRRVHAARHVEAVGRMTSA